MYCLKQSLPKANLNQREGGNQGTRNTRAFIKTRCQISHWRNGLSRHISIQNKRLNASLFKAPCSTNMLLTCPHHAGGFTWQHENLAEELGIFLYFLLHWVPWKIIFNVLTLNSVYSEIKTGKVNHDGVEEFLTCMRSIPKYWYKKLRSTCISIMSL